MNLTQTERTPDEYRAIAAGIKLPANDSDIVSVFAWPAMARYKRNGDEKRAVALAGWADLCQPAQWQTGLQAANDNSSTEDGWEKASWAESKDISTSVDADRIMEIRPTVMETMSAAFRVSVTRTRFSKSKWSDPIVRKDQLEFRSGKLVAYRKDGRRWYAGVVLRGEKGTARKTRKPADIERYLSLPGEPHIPQWRTHDGGRWVEPIERAAGARALLVQLGVNGDVPRERLKHPVKVEKTGIAKGAHWWGGIVAMKKQNQPKQAQVNICDIEAEMDRYGIAQRLRDRLDPVTVELLDCAISPMTARAIGEQFGKRGKYAERWALRAMDEALEKIAA